MTATTMLTIYSITSNSVLPNSLTVLGAGPVVRTNLITLGTLPVAVLATRLYMELAHAVGWPSWDAAPPLAALTALAPTLIMTVEQILRPDIVGQHIYMGPLLWLVILVGIAQVSAIVLEDTVVPRPDGVAPLAERWPDWAIRGLGVEGEP